MLLMFATVSFSTVSAQLINMEETWNEFLVNPKTAYVSDIIKPRPEQEGNYLKYHLMTANTNFCADKLDAAEDAMKVIKGIGESGYAEIPGFKERYDDLGVKIIAYGKVDVLWSTFLNSHDVTVEELEAIDKASTLCEKGTLAKYSLMATYDHYCNARLDEAKKFFHKRVTTLAERTSFDVKNVRGMEEEYKNTKRLFAKLKKLDAAWEEYIETDVSPGFEDDFPEYLCYPIPNMKVYMLRASVDVCKYGSAMLDLPKDTITDADLVDQLNASEFFCDKISQVKSWTMKGHLKACEEGQEYLDKIAEFKEEHSLEFDDVLSCKVQRLKIKVWDCRYWELVRQARKETHEERVKTLTWLKWEILSTIEK